MSPIESASALHWLELGMMAVSSILSASAG